METCGNIYGKFLQRWAIIDIHWHIIKTNFQAWHSTSFSWLCSLLIQSRLRTWYNSLRIKPRGGLSGFLPSPRHRVALRKQCVASDKVKPHTQQCSLEMSRVYRQEDKTYTATLNMNSPCFTLKPDVPRAIQHHATCNRITLSILKTHVEWILGKGEGHMGHRWCHAIQFCIISIRLRWFHPWKSLASRDRAGMRFLVLRVAATVS